RGSEGTMASDEAPGRAGVGQGVGPAAPGGGATGQGVGPAAPGGEPVRVGIAGQGRSGWGIHARTLQTMPEHFRVGAVADPLAARQEEARRTLGCRAYGDLDGLLGDDAVEVVVVSVPNRLHAAYSQAALAAGRHVVCEKPFALSVADADATIAAAQRAGRL